MSDIQNPQSETPTPENTSPHFPREVFEPARVRISQLQVARGLPMGALNVLTASALRAQKVEDESWIGEKIEQIKKRQAQPWFGYRKTLPNVRVPACRFIIENYGAWCLNLLSKNLKDATQCHSEWAVNFTAGMAAMGERNCRNAGRDLYEAVTKTGRFEQQKESRQLYHEWLNKNRKPQDGDQKVAGEPQTQQLQNTATSDTVVVDDEEEM